MPSTPPLEARRAALALALTGCVASAAFWVAFDDGAYLLVSRTVVAIAIWWALLLGVTLGLLPLARPGRTGIAAGLALTAFAAWTGLSIAWSPSAERSLVELDRVTLYLGVFTLALLGATRVTAGRWADGLAVGGVAVTGLALMSRFLPGVVQEEIPRLLTQGQARLSYPIGYWNALAVLSALACPLLLRAAVSARTAARSLAVVPLPAVAAVVYLASSRGGAAAALVGIGAFVVLTGQRWAAAAAVLAGAGGAAVAVAFLLGQDALVDGPLGSPAALAEGRKAALVVAGACLLAGTLHFLGTRYAPRGHGRVAAVAGWAAVVAVAALGAVGIAAARPDERFASFKAMPTDVASDDYVRSHLLSSSGNGRWQLWSSALDEWRSAPLRGRGAGTYEEWWAQHGTLPHFVRDAHSLYAETLGELGTVGLLLLLAALAIPIGAGLVRLRGRVPEERTLVAALLATALAFAFAAAFDWLWEVTAVGVIGVTCLGLLAGPATRPRTAGAGPRRRSRAVRIGWRVAAAGLTVAVLACQAVVLGGALELDRSEAAAARGDLPAALAAARRARAIEPWAAAPYLQLAQVAEQAGELGFARAAIRGAIERDPWDWRASLVEARVATAAGDADGARASLRRAIALNPRSALWRGLEPGR